MTTSHAPDSVTRSPGALIRPPLAPWITRALFASLGALTTLTACSAASAPATDLGVGDGGGDAPDLRPVIPTRADYTKAGPYAVGHAHATLPDRSGKRMLPVEIWYPADDSARAAANTGEPIEAFEVDATRSAKVATMAATAASINGTCTRKQTSAARDAKPLAMPSRFPLVTFSHCAACVRYSAYSIAERLASHGIAVAAPDHVTDTIFDSGALITNDFLAIRAGDIEGVLDALLDDQSMRVPAPLRGRFDPAHVGVMGHSFGAVTAGRVLADDPRVRGAFIIAAPIDSALLDAGVEKRITLPTYFLLATEDNSIGYLGNKFLGDNYAAAPAPSYLAEVADAGHWSFSDIAGLGGQFLAGCGKGKRQTDGTAFTYLDNDVGRGIGASYATGFFAGLLLGDPGAPQWLGIARPADVVTVSARTE
jgi:dienelactone hydrolase